MQVEEKSSRSCPAKQGMSSKAALCDVFVTSNSETHYEDSTAVKLRYAVLQLAILLLWNLTLLINLTFLPSPLRSAQIAWSYSRL